jgi:hypothetical protein
MARLAGSSRRLDTDRLQEIPWLHEIEGGVGREVAHGCPCVWFGGRVRFVEQCIEMTKFNTELLIFELALISSSKCS